MKKLSIMIIIFLVVLGVGFPYADKIWADTNKTIFIIPVNGEITPAMASFFMRSIEDAEKANANAILVEISTLGGRVDAALAMKQAIEGSAIPVIVYVKDRALSAGALISISAPRLIMAPGSHMGAAEPIPYSVKSVAAIRGEFEAAAERNGRDKTIAAAMVDKEVVVPGLSSAGSLLDITAETAKEYGYAEQVLEGRDNVLAYLGFEDSHIVDNQPDLLVRMAHFFTQSNIAALVLTIGIIAIIIEIFTSGFGVAGIIGISALTIYFGSNYIVGYSQWWPIILFVIGVILLIVEFFIPGFGVLGIAGICAMLVGIVFAASDPVKGMKNLGISLVLITVLTPLLLYYFKRFGIFRGFVLSDTVVDKSVNKEENIDTDLLGKKGIALTTLRPSGIVGIDNMKIDAISQGEFIEPGVQIKVVDTKGLSVVVAKDEDISG